MPRLPTMTQAGEAFHPPSSALTPHPPDRFLSSPYLLPFAVNLPTFSSYTPLPPPPLQPYHSPPAMIPYTHSLR